MSPRCPCAVGRVDTNWGTADFPVGRHADERVTELSGDVTIRLVVPRPADGANDAFELGQWEPYEPWLRGGTAQAIWTQYLGIAAPGERDAIWASSIASGIATRIVNALGVVVIVGGNAVPVAADASLVSQFAPDRPLTVGIRVDPSSLNFTPGVDRRDPDRSARESAAGSGTHDGRDGDVPVPHRPPRPCARRRTAGKQRHRRRRLRRDADSM